MVEGARLYSAGAYTAALSVLIGFLAVGFALSFLIREPQPRAAIA